MENFEYTHEASKMEEKIQEPIAGDKSTTTNPERSCYREELLKDKYKVHNIVKLYSHIAYYTVSIKSLNDFY